MNGTPYSQVNIDGEQIRDWASFHDIFASSFGFPGFYGKNMNAWIDCMTSLDSSSDGMTSVHAPAGGIVTIRIDHAEKLKANAPEMWEAINECSAFVNWRRMEMGRPPVLTLSYYS